MPPSTLPSPITTMKLRFSTGTSPNVLTYEQTIPSAAQGANSVQVTNSSLLAAFSSEPLGTIFTPSMVTTYSGFPSGDTLSTPSVVPNFIPRVISLADIPNKQLSVDAPFSLSSFISTLSTGVLSYTSSNASVATVHASTGLVTLVGEGTTTITVNQAADATYIAASASTTLTVTPPPLISLAANGVTIQYTGSAVDVPSSSPRFIQENPRGTGAEWFAVVKQGMKQQIQDYVSGLENSSSSFIPLGESLSVPFNNIVTTLMTDMSYLFQSQSQTQRNALHFDGVNDIVTLNSYPALNNTNQITIEGWVYATSYPKVIFMMNSSVSLEIWTEGRIMMYFVTNAGGVEVISDSAIPLNAWVHIAVVRNDNGYNKIYINNTIVKNVVSTTSGNFTTCTGMSLGGDAQAGSNYSNISMSEFRVWSVARTEQQIRDNYNREVASNSIGLEIYYKFNQGTANGNNTGLTTLTDSTSNNYHGTLQGMGLSGSSSNFVNGVTLYNLINSFDDNIASLDTSNVTSMNYMFYYVTVFNRDISKWDVSLVTPKPPSEFRTGSALTTTNIPLAFR